MLSILMVPSYLGYPNIRSYVIVRHCIIPGPSQSQSGPGRPSRAGNVDKAKDEPGSLVDEMEEHRAGRFIAGSCVIILVQVRRCEKLIKRLQEPGFPASRFKASRVIVKYIH